MLDSKHAIERRIHELPIPYTILAPAYFMQNAFNPWNVGALAADRFQLALPPDRPLQQLAIEDLASVAALVIEQREEFVDQRIELAGDELTGDQAAAALSTSPAVPSSFTRFQRSVSLPACARSSSGSHGSATTSTFPAYDAASPTSVWHRFDDWAAARHWSPRRDTTTTTHEVRA